MKGQYIGRLVLVFFLIAPTILYANDAPEKVLAKFNTSQTADEATQYLTGLMKKQLASMDKEHQEKILKSIQLKSYEAKTIPVNDNLQFVLAKNIKFSNGREDHSSLVYELVPVEGQWKIQNRSLGDSMILGLFKQKFIPNQFHTQNSFMFDGKKIMTESAFAYFKKEKDGKTEVIIDFYPFLFQDRDIEFFKYSSGPVVNDTDKPTAVASSIKYPQGEITVYLDEKDQIISFCQNGFHFDNASSGSYNDCIQDPSLIEKFTFTQNNLSLVTKSSTKMPNGKDLAWNIDVHLPVLKKGID